MDGATKNIDWRPFCTRFSHYGGDVRKNENDCNWSFNSFAKNDAGQESVSWQADSDVYPPVHRSMLLLKHIVLLLKHIVHFFTGWKMFEFFPQWYDTCDIKVPRMVIMVYRDIILEHQFAKAGNPVFCPHQTNINPQCQMLYILHCSELMRGGGAVLDWGTKS